MTTFISSLLNYSSSAIQSSLSLLPDKSTIVIPAPVSNTITQTSLFLAENGVTSENVIKGLAISIGAGLATAVVGKGLQEAGKSSKNKFVEKTGDVTFKIGELGLKAVLVPPVACAIGIKWFILEGIPNAASSGRTKRFLKSAFSLLIATPAIFVYGIVQRNMLNPTRDVAVSIFHFFVDFVLEIALSSCAYAIKMEVFIHMCFFLFIFFVCEKILLLFEKTASFIGDLFSITCLTIFLLWRDVLLPTSRFTRDKILIPFRDHILKPTWNVLTIIGRKTANGIQHTADAVSWIAGKVSNGAANGGTWLLEHVLRPVGRKIVWLFNKIVDGTVAAIKFIYNKVLVPIAIGIKKSAVWFFENVLIPIKNLFVKLFELLGRATVAILTAVKNSAVWVWEKILIPTAKFVKKCVLVFFGLLFLVFVKIGRAVSISALFVWNRIFKPVVLTVISVIVKISQAIASAAVWFWQTILFPIVTAIKNVLVGIWNAIISVSQSIWQNVIRPISVVISNLAVSVGNAVWSVVVSVSNMVVSTVSALSVIISQVMTSVANTVVAIAQAIARVFGG